MIIKVHVSPDDKAMIERAAKTERRSVSSYVAVAAVEKARAFIPPVLTPEHEASLAAEYGQDAVARYYEGRALWMRAAERAKGGGR